MGVGWWGRGGWREGGRKVEAPPLSFSVMLSQSGVPGHTWKLSHECVSTVCTHSVPVTHVCPVHTNTRKRYNTPHAFLPLLTALLTVLSNPSDKAAWYSTSHCVSVPLHICLVPPLSPLFLCFHTAVWCQWANFHNRINHPRRPWACQFSATVRSVLMWHCNDHKAKPAGFYQTGKSQAELAVLIVNNKSLLRQSPTAGTYHQAADSTLFLWLDFTQTH